MSDAEALGAIQVHSSDGEETVLGSLWREQPTAIAFLRQFG